MRCKICVSIIEGTSGGVIAAAKEADEAGADLIEIRLDWVEQLSCQLISDLFSDLHEVRLPKIATVMPISLFGRFRGDEPERKALLLKAAEQADYVDVGLEMGTEPARDCLEGIHGKGKAETILSMHSKRPLRKGEIKKIVRQNCNYDCVHKIVMPAVHLMDNLVALEACLSLEGFRRIIFCYNCTGTTSRILGPLFGSEWAYASLRKGRESAPGQLDIGAMRKAQEAL